MVLSCWTAWTVALTGRGGQPLVDLRLALTPGVLGPNALTFGVGLDMYGLLTLIVILVQSDGGYGLGHGVAVVGPILVAVLRAGRQRQPVGPSPGGGDGTCCCPPAPSCSRYRPCRC